MTLDYYIRYLPYIDTYYIVPNNHSDIRLPNITIKSKSHIRYSSLYNNITTDSFSRLLCAYICIDLLYKRSSDWTIERVLENNFPEILTIVRQVR